MILLLKPNWFLIIFLLIKINLFIMNNKVIIILYIIILFMIIITNFKLLKKLKKFKIWKVILYNNIVKMKKKKYHKYI